MKNVRKWKALLFFLFSSFLVIAVLARYFDLMVLESSENNVSESSATVERGPILDRNGKILAIQTKLYSVAVWMPSLKEREKSAEKLAGILDIGYEDILAKMKGKSRFVYIQRKITPAAAEKIKALAIPGVMVDPEYGRSYPEKKLASHLIGYVGTDNTGLDGIEYTMDRSLSPDLEGSSGGTVYGNQVFLTIDLNIQNFAHQASAEAMEKYDAESVVTLVADAETADILAYVCIPEIDLNNFERSDLSEKMNRPVMFAYEPGSVFKIFSISSFMELGGITSDSHFFCNGYYKKSVKGKDIVIKCTGRHGDVDPAKIIKYSCNAAAYASDTVSEDDFYYMLDLFGMGEKTGVELLGETAGLLRDVKNWSERSKATITIGQEISVSAMQIIRAATVIANHGIMLSPHIIKKVLDHSGQLISENSREEIRQVLSPSVADGMISMMEGAVEPDGGTARRVGVKGVRMAMKTGTAQVLDPKTKKYSDDKFTASSLAIFPAEDPKIIIYNIIFSPRKGGTTGALLSVPIVGKISDQIISYLGIPREGDLVAEHDGTVVIEQKNYAVEDTLPDFTGASKKALLHLFSDSRFRIKISGEGWCVSQSPPPGTPVERDMMIKLEFK